MNEKVIGIDLGTGNSCVAVMEGGKPVVIANSEGSRTTPSVVYIDGETREVGGGAKRRMTMNRKNTISFIMSFLGAIYSDADVQ
jgi:molecular chaperone DnaK